ncbi:hypothetical protein ADL12_02240 [Streptomyces regalis]|uniref:Uncharacterized protein n=1 Tax=Streptomyces regalis TaxID=68262 RepID=A0A0X3VPT5_9ACTN|nr:hypothetical protein ADL12_02240 [Streptomyces regalis]
MHSDVVNRAAAQPVGEALPTGRGTESGSAEGGRAPLTSLSLLGEQGVRRASSIDNHAYAIFQSCI